MPRPWSARRSAAPRRPTNHWVWPASSGWRISSAVPHSPPWWSATTAIFGKRGYRKAELSAPTRTACSGCTGTTPRSSRRRASTGGPGQTSGSAREPGANRAGNGCDAAPRPAPPRPKARIGKAHETIGELAEVRARRRVETADIDFTATDRRTKRLVQLKSPSLRIRRPHALRRSRFRHHRGDAVGLGRRQQQRQDDAAAAHPGRARAGLGRVERAEGLRIVISSRAAGWIRRSL